MAARKPADEGSKVISSTPRLYINAEQRQNSLQDSRDADQHHQQLEQLRQAAISGKLVDRPKTDGADDNDNQNTNQGRKHRAPLCRDSALHHHKSIARGCLHAKGFPGRGIVNRQNQLVVRTWNYFLSAANSGRIQCLSAISTTL